MKVAMLAPIAWRTPPRQYGPWERVASLLTEELVRCGIDVTLFATKDSLTHAKLEAVCAKGYAEAKIDAKVWESLHIAHCFEHADEFDIIHNHFDFLPLTYSKLIHTPLLTTIHGFSSNEILPVYQKYSGKTHYVSISDHNRSPQLTYDATIYHGIDVENFTYQNKPTSDYLLFFGRIHPDKGAKEAIAIADRSGKYLVMAGIVQDTAYFETFVAPAIMSGNVRYLGNIGHEERNVVLGGATALLHPIAFDEPFGLSVVEALACGTPVIAFNRGSMSEILEHGKTGYLVSSVEEAVHCIPIIDKISRKDCRRVAEKRFRKETMAQNYINLYKKIISGA